MATTLEEMRCEMKKGLEDLRSLEHIYPNSRAFAYFLDAKERDYEEFLRIVSPLRRDTFAPYVVGYLRDIRADRKFFGMTQRTSGYFKVTKKLMKKIEVGL